MKKFHFPLDRVREYRLLQLEGEQLKLEELRVRLAGLDEMVAEIVRQRQHAERSLLGEATSGVELRQYAGYRGYAVRVSAMIHARRQQVSLDIDAQRGSVLDARRKYEMLDRLKTRSQGVWRAECNREQENLAGELYLARWGAAAAGR